MTPADRDLPVHLSSTLDAVCAPLPVPISIADPDQPDTPLIYVNPAFEELTQYSMQDAVGRNCRFLQGELTDRTVTVELAEACARMAEDACCLINYRKDGSTFFNLLVIRPIHIKRQRTFLMGCQFAFTPTQIAGTMAQTCALVDRAQRQLRMNKGARNEGINVHDVYRLDSVAMRFETAFIRVKNMLIKGGNEKILAEFLRQCTEADEPHAPVR